MRQLSSEEILGCPSPEFWAWFEDRILRSLDRRDRAPAARIADGTRARVERNATEDEAAGQDAHPVALLRWDGEA